VSTISAPPSRSLLHDDAELPAQRVGFDAGVAHVAGEHPPRQALLIELGGEVMRDILTVRFFAPHAALRYAPAIGGTR
jgi:hypothetical protein